MNRATTIVSWLLGIYLGAGSCLGGEVTGRVVITKTLTKKRVTLPSYQLRAASLPLREESPSVNELDRLAIYLEGPKLKAGTPVRVELNQKNIRFDPEILIVPVGSTISFPNSDPIFHNVFSFSKARQFDLGYYPAGQSRQVKFEQLGVVQIYCHLHPQMSSAILVVPSAWYTKPGKNGTFTLSEIPAGTYDVIAWHKSAGYFRRKIEVSETGSVAVDFMIPIREQE